MSTGAVPEVWIVERSQACVDESALSLPERARADRFTGPDDRRQYVRTRVALRTILSERLDVEPARLEIGCGPHGAPRVAWPHAELCFSVSHSGDLALIALACGRQTGVDVELVRRELDIERIATRWFHPRETARLQRHPPHQQRQAFFAYWTAKEAYVKALGLGLRKPLRGFEIDVRDRSGPVLVSDPGEPVGAWTLRALSIAPGYAATLAVHEDPATSPWPRVQRFR